MPTVIPAAVDNIPDDPERPVRVWAITFGSKHANDPHPAELPRGAQIHPDGWVELHVRGGANDVRLLAFVLFGPFWSDLIELPSTTFPMDLFPLGCLATFDAPRGGWLVTA